MHYNIDNLSTSNEHVIILLSHYNNTIYNTTVYNYTEHVE